MRIRKRWPLPTHPPLPSSSSSSLPLLLTLTSDLPSTNPLNLQSQSQSQSGGSGLKRLADLSVVHVSSSSSRQSPPRIPQRPDLQITIVRGTNGWICAGTDEDVNPDSMHPTSSPPTHLQDSQAGVVAIAGGGGIGREYVEDKRRNENYLGAATSVGTLALSSLSHQVGGRWCEGERVFPLKKRRGSFERMIIEAADTIKEKEKKMETKVRTKVGKKWVHEDEDKEDDDDEEEEENQGQREAEVVVHGKGAKKRGSTVGVIMEGSRCSRVNGRGWRCCQQTLVGYSLCEHHLGKGRLRSMSSVRNRGSTIVNITKKEEESGLLSSSSSSSTTQLLKRLHQKSMEEEEEDDDEEPLMTSKKRKKIGMVKARSISSLLGQRNLLHQL
ncbi:hypothetical protein NE237_004052 [Protea cynaroides]|uniref:WRC domain-containing protein n=1 Tax=Protea cynaroides TaxID=273540 RepID=A0A9Q0KHY3_9MAGN|nr:hypothetical protein NE237_004052 [Protea cynaroides]